jgi:cytochrome c oxidase subunit II
MPRALGARRFFLSLLLAAAGLLTFAAGAPADALTPESGGSPNADDIDTLYTIVLIIAAIVLLGVEGTLLLFIIRYRARKGRVAAQIHGNTKLEIGWTLGAAAIVVALAVITFVMFPSINDPEASDTASAGSLAGAQLASVDRPKVPGGRQLEIGVNGQQYIWRYEYPGGAYSYEEMIAPAGVTVVLRIVAQDVAHSWWIPKLGGKADALPGYTNYTWFKAPKAGVVYTGQCAELCGRNHANMVARVRIVTPEEYRLYTRGKKGQIDTANRDAARARRALTPRGQGQEE